ncbi:ribosomal protein S5 domain 2-type protein [Sordaria brevicollis]|uniref:Small ribosomal subunit protein uS9m n=1 Tax=Sordaria brevicollis TaxID=83679 RepID=A0AAE0PNY7_SORBR|nr:ribosomal protein S5 domain 2-type protein [Sordaria brevicollis]
MMASLRHSITNALRSSRQACNKPAQWQSLEQQFGALRIGSRSLSTFSNTEPNPNDDSPIVAAPPVSVDHFKLHPYARAVPVSPSYFTRTPRFYDNYLALEKLMEQYEELPVIPATAVERVAWKTLDDIRQELGEQVKASEFARCMVLVKRLNSIHPDLKPKQVKDVLDGFKRSVQPFTNTAKPIPIDQFGRACGVGRRKASSARAFVVEGTGEVLVNGKTLAEYFGRVHDRESAVWALRATNRIDKYNVWIKVEGGGTTGQAEAITLAIAKGLLAHEPALKPALRRAGCITRDPRKVERKKHGHVKARKMPTWVKR